MEGNIVMQKLKKYKHVQRVLHHFQIKENHVLDPIFQDMLLHLQR